MPSPAPASPAGDLPASPPGGSAGIRAAVVSVLVRNRVLLVGLVAVTALVLRPGEPVPSVTSPGARVALETTRFLVTSATAGLLTTVGGGVGGPLRRGFVAALVVLGLTDLLLGVVPEVVGGAVADAIRGGPVGARDGAALLPWIAARAVAGTLLVVAALEWPRWSTHRVVWTGVAVFAAVQLLVVLAVPAVAATPDGGLPPAVLVLELGPMGLFVIGAVLAERLHLRDGQPLERWLATALLVSAATQVHQAAQPIGLGPQIGSADALRALSAALLLTGAVQQVVQLRADRIRALALAQADVRELRAMGARLQAHVDREAAFRSLVTHELATPIAAIGAWAHVAEGAEPAVREQGAAAIVAEARRLRALVERMDELAGDGGNALPVDPRPVLVAPLLEEAAAFGRALPGGHPVSAQAEDQLLHLDPTRASQALRNLVANAIRYSPDGTPVRLVGRAVDDGYEVAVLDEGPGFGVADAAPLLERDRRGPAAAGHEGSGLGLWVAQQVIAAHGGDLRVVDPSRPGGRVVVRLPVGAA